MIKLYQFALAFGLPHIGGESQFAHQLPRVWYFSQAIERCRENVSANVCLSSKRNSS